VPSGWEAVAVADRTVYDRVEAPEVVFPLVSPTRRFVLAGDRVTIGRRSASRGIIPDIDLSAAPEDAGVSHLHATLVFQPDGTWAAVDAGSANGTYLNDQTDPIARNELVPLIEGDRLHVGAWTTITLHRSAPPDPPPDPARPTA
jgi:pSer/pThr/pTyr-binding forkhead associated (FHA) protein